MKNGKVFAAGDYVSQFSFDGYRKIFEWDVYWRLDDLLRRLRVRLEADGEECEARQAALIHRDCVMAHFYSHATTGKRPVISSQSVCYSCLFEPPEHALPCGHIICTACLKAYGKSQGRNVVDIQCCPLEPLQNSQQWPWRVIMKPAAAGIRILTLDGSVTALSAFRIKTNSICGF